jgi:hypothetical protein
MYGSTLHFMPRRDHKNRYKTPSPVFLLMTKRASLSQTSGGSVRYKLAQPAYVLVLSCHQSRGRKTAFSKYLSDFHFSRLKLNYQDQFTVYSRSNITNLVVGNGMLQQMLLDVLLMHVEVSNTSGNCNADITTFLSAWDCPKTP